MLFCHPEKGKKAPPITILGEDSPPFFLSHPKAKLEAMENVGSSLPMLSAKNKAKTAACPFFILGKKERFYCSLVSFHFVLGRAGKLAATTGFTAYLASIFPNWFLGASFVLKMLQNVVR